MQASAVDATEAAHAAALVREEEQVIGRHIPARVLMTRTSPFCTWMMATLLGGGGTGGATPK
jgi:hypothetical protein